MTETCGSKENFETWKQKISIINGAGEICATREHFRTWILHFMLTKLMDGKHISWPECSPTNVARQWETLHVNSFNVILDLDLLLGLFPTQHRLKKSPYPTFGDKNYILVWRIFIILYFFWCLLLILIWIQVYSSPCSLLAHILFTVHLISEWNKK